MKGGDGGRGESFERANREGDFEVKRGSFRSCSKVKRRISPRSIEEDAKITRRDELIHSKVTKRMFVIQVPHGEEANSEIY